MCVTFLFTPPPQVARPQPPCELCGLQPTSTSYQVHVRDLVPNQVPDGEVELSGVVLDGRWPGRKGTAP